MKKKVFIGITICLLITIIIGIIIATKIRKQKDYELLKTTEYKFFKLTKDGKEGVIRRDGQIILEPQYDNIEIPNQDIPIFIATTGEKSEVYNDSKEKIMTDLTQVEVIKIKKEDGIVQINNTVLKYKENDKYGLVDFDGKKITKPLYEEISALEDKNGEIKVKKDGKYGAINIKGNILIKAKYDFIKGDGYSKNGDFKIGGYIVGNKSNQGIKYGYLNKNGKEIIKIEEENLYRVTEIESDDAYIVASQNGRYSIFKGKNKLVDYKYLEVNYNKDSKTFTVRKNQSYGLLDIEAKEIIKPEYEQLLVAGEYVNAYKNNENYVFDLQGNRVKEPEYVSLEKTKTEKYYIVMNKEYKYGIIDKDKNVVIEPKYDYIRQINNTDLILASIGNDVTVYSANIKEIVSHKNASVDIVNEYIKITTQDDVIYLSLEGKEIDNNVVFANNEIYTDKKGGKWGFVNSNDEVIVDYIYDEVTEVNEYGFAGIKKDGKWGVINSKGEVILEPTYESTIKNPVFIGEYYKNGSNLTNEM